MSFKSAGVPIAKPEAFARMYQEFHPRAVNLCLVRLGSIEEAEDAASEIFARASRLGVVTRAPNYSGMNFVVCY